jgi:MoxR-like ATPase
MPADILGTNLVMEGEDGRRRFEFQKGPVFAHLLLADEINRATPKTQSALLEAMQEGQVTAGGEVRPLPRPFFVLATQNPIDQEGTYPLPEAQLDRFFFKLRMGFPGVDELHTVLDRTTLAAEPRVERTLAQGEILEMRETAREVPVARPVQDYAIRLTLATHPESELGHEMARRYVRFGASPRGTQALILGAKVHALMHDRLHVSGEDIRAVALPALRHRLLVNFEAEADRIDTDTILQRILADVAGPA